MDYLINLKLKLHLKNVKDQYEALSYAEDFASFGLESLCYSDDEDDDHYELMGCEIDMASFREI